MSWWNHDVPLSDRDGGEPDPPVSVLNPGIELLLKIDELGLEMPKFVAAILRAVGGEVIISELDILTVDVGNIVSYKDTMGNIHLKLEV